MKQNAPVGLKEPSAAWNKMHQCGPKGTQRRKKKHQRDKAPWTHTSRHMKQNALESTKWAGLRMKQNVSMWYGRDAWTIIPNVSWNKYAYNLNIAWNKMREQSETWHEIKCADT